LDREEIFNLTSGDPIFLNDIFFHLLKSHREDFLVKLFDISHEAHLSSYFDASGIQESLKFRALNRARRLSLRLIDEKGEIRKSFLQNVLVAFERGFLFYPAGLNDGLLCEHMLSVLRFFDSKEGATALKRFHKTVSSKWGEELIFETLGISPQEHLSDGLVRSAVLCACLTPLRQNVGSCFATAPAILIQSDHILLFLDDLYQLLSTGKLKRTFGGIEYSLPLSPSTGVGDLTKKIGGEAKGWLCPGVLAVLECAGVLDPTRSLEEKSRVSQSIIGEFSQKKSSLTTEDLIRFVLLEKFSLSEADVRKERSLRMAEFKSSKMALGFSPVRDSEKLSRILTFLEKEKRCRAAFKGMCDNALLKSWEFTVASFSEVKMEFSRWNLYSSLGFAPEEKGGIGELIYKRIDEKIAEVNKNLEEAQKEYEIAFDQLKATESLMRNVSSESEARRLQAELQSRTYHMRACLDKRDALYSRGSNYSKLFSFLIKQYDEKFPEYFQEIYDAEMQDFQGELYDDSPAGFRLVYKHGRTDPALWTLIHDAEQYIDALLSFFSATESQIAASCEWEGGDQDVLELNAAIIAYIRTDAFLESSLQRMAKAHASFAGKNPLGQLHQLEKKPWAYTSGGTMTTLLKTYYRREAEFTQEEKWVESESELLIFILDTLKSLPPRITDPYLQDPRKGMLMTSPTHAFILLPGQENLSKGWQDNIFTYTWVRDEIFLPSQTFYSEMRLSGEAQEFLFSKLCQKLPLRLGEHLERVFHNKEEKISILEWRNYVISLAVKHLEGQTQKKALVDIVDSFLYLSLPLTSGKDWKSVVQRLLSDKMTDKLNAILQKFSDVSALFLTANEVKEMAKGCYLLSQDTLCLSFDLHLFIAQSARSIGLAQPTPLLFADTNWSGNYFGFVVNPSTERLELWRLDQTLSEGVPMSSWKHWLNGVDRKTWSIFSRPYEYEMTSSSIAIGTLRA